MIAVAGRSSIATIPQVQRMLERATTIGEILQVENLAERVRDFAKAAGMGRDSVNTATRYALDARRKAGATLVAMKKRGELAERGMSRSATFTLDDLDLNRTQASHYQQEASVPQDVYERWIQRVVEGEDGVLSATSLRKLARRLKSANSDQCDETRVDFATAKRLVGRYIANLGRRMVASDRACLPDLLRALSRDCELTGSVAVGNPRLPKGKAL
jgi:hypothetical protein